MIERRYALRRVGAGDYLLLANDGQTLYRLVRYIDGPIGGLTEWKRNRWVWSVYRWVGRPLSPGRSLTERELELASSWWVESYSALRSRREAIGWALR